MELEFIEKEHKYIDQEGNVIPGVTDILSMLTGDGVAKINPAVLEHAAERGTLVHEWCQMYDYECAEEQVPSELEPYCHAYMDFVRDYRPQWHGIEQVIYCDAMQTGRGYAGTLDRIGMIAGKMSVVDIKTIASPTKMNYISVCCQTAAYAWATQPLAKRYALYLKPDGKYRLFSCDEYELKNGFSGYDLWKKIYGLYTEIHEI